MGRRRNEKGSREGGGGEMRRAVGKGRRRNEKGSREGEEWREQHYHDEGNGCG